MSDDAVALVKDEQADDDGTNDTDVLDNSPVSDFNFDVDVNEMQR